MDDGLKKGEIGWSVHNVKEVKKKGEIFCKRSISEV
jgi:hypothetical protein